MICWARADPEEARHNACTILAFLKHEFCPHLVQERSLGSADELHPHDLEPKGEAEPHAQLEPHDHYVARLPVEQFRAEVLEGITGRPQPRWHIGSIRLSSLRSKDEGLSCLHCFMVDVNT